MQRFTAFLSNPILNSFNFLTKNNNAAKKKHIDITIGQAINCPGNGQQSCRKQVWLVNGKKKRSEMKNPPLKNGQWTKGMVISSSIFQQIQPTVCLCTFFAFLFASWHRRSPFVNALLCWLRKRKDNNPLPFFFNNSSGHYFPFGACQFLLFKCNR